MSSELNESRDLLTILQELGISNCKFTDIIELLSPRSIRYIKKDLQDESTLEKLKKLQLKTNIETKNEVSINKSIDNSINKSINKSIDNSINKSIDKSTLYIFTDGACKNNGKSNAVGGYGFYIPSLDKLKAKNVESPTNQKCELLAIQKSLQYLDTIDLSQYNSIIICSDSMYSINCITKWSKNWEKSNWKTAKGENVKHDTIIKTILELYKKYNFIKFKHVFSHLSEPKVSKNSSEYYIWNGNKKIDEYINEYIDEYISNS
jgi:ribonuclease HI